MHGSLHEDIDSNCVFQKHHIFFLWLPIGDPWTLNVHLLCVRELLAPSRAVPCASTFAAAAAAAGLSTGSSGQGRGSGGQADVNAHGGSCQVCSIAPEQGENTCRTGQKSQELSHGNSRSSESSCHSSFLQRPHMSPAEQILIPSVISMWVSPRSTSLETLKTMTNPPSLVHLHFPPVIQIKAHQLPESPGNSDSA